MGNFPELISFIGWWIALNTQKDNPCPHPKAYRQTIRLENVTSVIVGAMVCGTCMEAYCQEDLQRICASCHKPIVYGAWVNPADKIQTRLVHHKCSSKEWVYGKWMGDRVVIVGHGI